MKPRVEHFLAARGWSLSPTNTRMIHRAAGFDFRGQNIRMARDKRLIKPSRQSVQSLLRRGREVIQANQSTPAGQWIGQLNPLLRGWANEHRHVVSQATLATMDHAIFPARWGWAKRRHPHKPPGWLRQTYVTRVADNRWGCYGPTMTSHGTTQVSRLRRLAATPITRHIKVKAEANPYDPAWERDFETRRRVKMADSLKGRRSLRSLGREQDGSCPVCHQSITPLTGWRSHHRVWRAQGGSDGAAHRVWRHPNGHRQVHRPGVDVATPRPPKGGRVKGLSG